MRKSGDAQRTLDSTRCRRRKRRYKIRDFTERADFFIMSLFASGFPGAIFCASFRACLDIQERCGIMGSEYL